MAVEFNLQRITVPTPVGEFGFNPSLLVTRGAVAALRGALFRLEENQGDEAVDYSDLNTPVIDNVIFEGGEYIDFDGNTIEYPPLIINTAVVDVTKPKNIVETRIQGRNGSVKEYIASDDFVISIRGFIVSENNQLPLDDLRTLNIISDAPQQIGIVSTYLNEVFEINDIVIKRISMPRVEGYNNQVPFRIEAVSDVPLDLEELVID
jgi:hypothetical protein